MKDPRHVALDSLADLIDLWPDLVDQRTFATARRSGPTRTLTEEQEQDRDRQARAERRDRVEQQRRGLRPIGASPAPVDLLTLEVLADVESALPWLEENVRAHLGEPLAMPESRRQLPPGTLGPLELIPATPRPRWIAHPAAPAPKAAQENAAIAGRDPLDAMRWLHGNVLRVGDDALVEHVAKETRSACHAVRRALGDRGRYERIDEPCELCDCMTLVHDTEATYDKPAGRGKGRGLVVCTLNERGRPPVCICLAGTCPPGCKHADGTRHSWPYDTWTARHTTTEETSA